MKPNLTLTLLALLLSLASFGLSPISGSTGVCAGSTTTLTDSVAGGIRISSTTSVATVNSSSGAVYGVSAGTTIITYYLSGSYVTMPFTVHPTPVAITGGSSVCTGNTIT